MLTFFENAQIVIDKGADHGLRRGQWMTTLDERVTPRQVRRSELGSYNSDGTAMLRIVTTYSDESVAQILEFGIDAYVERMEKTSDLAPVVRGQRVLGLPFDESEASEGITRAVEKAERQQSRAGRRLYLREAIDAADRFLAEHPNSFLLPDVLFDLGHAQKDLGQRAAALRTFRRFVEDHPFHESAEPVREEIEELERPRAARDR